MRLPVAEKMAFAKAPATAAVATSPTRPMLKKSRADYWADLDRAIEAKRVEHGQNLDIVRHHPPSCF